MCVVLIGLSCAESAPPPCEAVDCEVDNPCAAEPVECTAEPLMLRLRSVRGDVVGQIFEDRTGVAIEPLPMLDPAFTPDVDAVVARHEDGIVLRTGAIVSACGTDVACLAEMLQGDAAALLRRPLSAAEAASLSAAIGEGSSDEVASVLWQARLAPESLIVFERGGDAAGRELADRFARLVWRTGADAALVELVENPHAFVDALLGDPRAGRGAVAMHERWLHAGVGALHPTLAVDMEAETGLYLASVLADGGATFGTLLRAPYTFANDALAEHYGFDARPGDFARVEVPERYNLLTHGSVAAGGITQRGRAVLAGMLCTPPPEPPDFDPTIPDDVEGDTERERLQAFVSMNPACVSCHALIDPFGHALEAYDTYESPGRYRGPSANDLYALPECVGGTTAGEGMGAADLAGWIVRSPDARRCYVEQLVTEFGELDHCAKAQVDVSETRGDVSLHDLFVQAVTLAYEPTSTDPGSHPFVPLPTDDLGDRLPLRTALVAASDRVGVLRTATDERNNRTLDDLDVGYRELQIRLAR